MAAEIDSQAPTVEEAIQKGLEELKVEKDRVHIRILDEGSTGLFGLMGAKPAIVRITVKENTASPAGTGADAGARISVIIKELFNLMQAGRADIRTETKGEDVFVNVDAPDSSLLIGKHGQTLQALQVLVSIIAAQGKNTALRVHLDVNGYRRGFEQRLVDTARQAADDVRCNGGEKRLPAMPARDRRVIHLALKEDKDIVTVSDGEGSTRCIIIKPKH